jgi:hypothetical protein
LDAIYELFIRRRRSTRIQPLLPAFSLKLSGTTAITAIVIRIGGPIDERFVHEREPWDFDALHAASTCATGLARRISRA